MNGRVVADGAGAMSSATDNNGLVVSNLVVAYGGARAVDGLSIHVSPSTSVALLGSNGAGKSSTIRAISGVLGLYGGQWVSGSLNFEGRPMSGLPARQIVRGGIAQVPEGRKVFAELSTRDNLRVAVAKSERGAVEDKVDAVFDLFPALKSRSKTLAGWLSGGEQQMLAIGRALMTSPRLLMIDELSLGLAPKVVYTIVEQLELLRNQTSIGILLVEQNARLALKFSDYAYVVENGVVVHDGPSQVLAGDAEVEARYLGGTAHTTSAAPRGVHDD